jgi:hypothetical protein
MQTLVKHIGGFLKEDVKALRACLPGPKPFFRVKTFFLSFLWHSKKLKKMTIATREPTTQSNFFSRKISKMCFPEPKMLRVFIIFSRKNCEKCFFYIDHITAFYICSKR